MKIIEEIIKFFANQVNDVNWIAISFSVSVATITVYIKNDNVYFLMTGVLFFALTIFNYLVKQIQFLREKHIVKKIDKRQKNDKWQREFCEKLSVEALRLLKQLDSAENGIKINKGNRYILELLHFQCVEEIPPTSLENGQYYSYYILQPWAVSLVSKQTMLINKLLKKRIK